MSKIRLLKTLKGMYGVVVKVYVDTEYGEYQVRIDGSPDATYHTDGRNDALNTAEVMRADAEINARLANADMVDAQLARMLDAEESRSQADDDELRVSRMLDAAYIAH